MLKQINLSPLAADAPDPGSTVAVQTALMDPETKKIFELLITEIRRQVAPGGGENPDAGGAAPTQVAVADAGGVFVGSTWLMFNPTTGVLQIGPKGGTHINVSPGGLKFFGNFGETEQLAAVIEALSINLKVGNTPYDTMIIRGDIFEVMLPTQINDPTFKLPQLPTAVDGLAPGTLWNNAGVVNVAP